MLSVSLGAEALFDTNDCTAVLRAVYMHYLINSGAYRKGRNLATAGLARLWYNQSHENSEEEPFSIRFNEAYLIGKLHSSIP